MQVEWEIRPHWVLEIMINDPKYVYSKRVIHIDATPVDQGGNYRADWMEAYDQKGRLLRGWGYVAKAANKEGFTAAFGYGTVNYQTDHYTLIDFFPGYFNFDKLFPLKEDEVFTISALLRRVR